MDIAKIIAKLDAEIASRSDLHFGIKVGSDVYHELARAGKLKVSTFTALGVGAFPMEFMTYDGKVHIFEDPFVSGDDVAIGAPRSNS